MSAMRLSHRHDSTPHRPRASYLIARRIGVDLPVKHPTRKSLLAVGPRAGWDAAARW
jgi:hypothetical protein